MDLYGNNTVNNSGLNMDLYGNNSGNDSGNLNNNFSMTSAGFNASNLSTS